MKKQKIVKITESELTRLIKLMIIKEQLDDPDVTEPTVKPDVDTPTRKDPRRSPFSPPPDWEEGDEPQPRATDDELREEDD
ncbi:hypothetical protein COB55_03410 [Candidatus Wolfebacteria bacterium]|nr:MAG: hypothetical protein COB55_03410 [Candidatus Wolfebacteria bacterium]